MTNPFPEWVEPMAPVLTQDRFGGPEWIFERKFDGIRLLAFRNGTEIRLLSRNRLPQDLPAIAAAVRALPTGDLILDGEVTWSSMGPLYHVFDLLRLDGYDVTREPIETRRKLLDGLPLRIPLARVEWLRDERPWERARRERWEGVIAKRRGSPYQPGRRPPDWFKMKCEVAQDFVVGGFTDPQGSRVGLGALLVGYFQGDRFRFAGKVGTGLDRPLLLSLRDRLGALEIDKPPFHDTIGVPRLRSHWVRPEVVVRVSFIEWTVNDKLRHPRLVGLQEGRDPRQVVREPS